MGFRTSGGILSTTQSFQTMTLPQKAHGIWDHRKCLTWGQNVFEYVRRTIGDSSKDVWRVEFVPSEGIRVRMLGDEDVMREVEDGDDEERVGFLPKWFWDRLGEEEFEESPSERQNSPMPVPPAPISNSSQSKISGTTTTIAGWII